MDLEAKRSGVRIKIFIYSNSQSAICLTKNPVFHVRIKHIDFRYQFMREIISDG